MTGPSDLAAAGKDRKADGKLAGQGLQPQSVSRRSLLKGAASFVAGLVTGVAGTYLTDLSKTLFPPGETADAFVDSAPVRTFVSLEHDTSKQGVLWILPFKVSEKPDFSAYLLQGNDLSNLPRKIVDEGGVDANLTILKLIVEGRRNSTVRIIGMRAIITKKTSPLTGVSVLTPGPQGVGSSQVGFDLDSMDLEAREVSQEDGASSYQADFFREPFFASETAPLARQGQEVFQVVARTVKSHIEWFIEIDLLVDNSRVQTRVGIGENPIITSALWPDGEDNTSPDPAYYDEIYAIDEGLASFSRVK